MQIEAEIKEFEKNLKESDDQSEAERLELI